MGLFSKHPCVFCGEQVGFIKGKKIQGGDYICKECEKNCSAYLEVSRFDKAFLEEHLEYMKKQDVLYKKEFETLDKKDVKRIVRSYNGIAFADSIGMFEVISPKYNKKNQRELFRYDQILDFRYYTVPNNGQGQKKYAESGLEIDLKCVFTKDGFRNTAVSKNNSSVHPYVASFRIPFAKDTDDANAASLAKHHLNELFGRASEHLAGSIKESFTGTGKEQAQMKAGVDALKSLGGLAKSAIKKDDEGMKNAKKGLANAVKDELNATLNYGARYTKIADDAEKRAWE